MWYHISQVQELRAKLTELKYKFNLFMNLADTFIQSNLQHERFFTEQQIECQ